ncbi:c-type cytochrome [Sphingorhabdus contaminans]|uniref:Cytochrome c domain-containing protein n=1 Tax=Sphingorhabdus contaminans TaxID=1343899 RepID=A0A553WAG5_9SPHN|nr:hypothetical protein [Sphingorhabdus contaminans]TSB01671.1 hypothetical protein FOM92_10855 [Sphingorhabdus contaminans]
MTEAISGPSSVSKRIEWSIIAVALTIDLTTIFLPRADKALPLREDLRNIHMFLGTILFILVASRLIRWIRGDLPQTPQGISTGAAIWGMVLLASVYMLQIANPIVGFVTAWAQSDLPLQAGGHGDILHRATWLFSGYMHSAIAFGITLLKVAVVLTMPWLLFRHGKGALSGLPAGLGFWGLASMSSTVFAFSTFKSYENGPTAVGIFWLLCFAIWGLARLFRRNRATANDTPELAKGWKRGLAVATAGAIAAFGLYGPYAMFRVSPFEKPVNVAAAAGVTSHAAPAKTEIVQPETDFERQVRAETFKWCTFCHSMKKGGAHMAGPNLYGIYGQTIATVPNFPYGDALVARGKRGEKWDDAALDALLADPDKFAPGTTMVISSGNITDPARRKAIINILKRETGAAAQ